MPDRRAGHRVTVVESDDAVREITTEILDAAGYAVTPLANGDALHQAIAESHPQLIVLDLRLGRDLDPHRSWDLLRDLRAHPLLERVPVLICSADTRALRDRSAELDADPMMDALAKPFSVDELEQRVAKLLDGGLVPSWQDDRDLVLVADAQSRLLDASVRALRLLGLTIEQLRTRSVADIVAFTREWTAREWQRYLDAGVWHGEVMLRTADGREILALSNAEILRRDGHEWHISRLDLAQ